METLQRTANRGSISTGFDIDNSLKLEEDNTEYLHYTPSSQTDYERLTFSLWIKRTEIGLAKLAEFGNGSANTNNLRIGFDTSDRLYIYGNSIVWRESTQVFRDTSAWYHLFFKFDTTQGTSNDKIRVWVNGNMIAHTDYNTVNNPSSGSAMGFNTTLPQSIGTQQEGGVNASSNFNGYIAQVWYSGGTPPNVTDFGEVDSDSGIWKPIDISEVSIPDASGFFLDFSDSSDLGNDSSSNNNNFTLNNITSADQATDTPTNTFCTLNQAAFTLTDATISQGATSFFNTLSDTRTAVATMAVTKGKWYFEYKFISSGGSTYWPAIGFTNAESTSSSLSAGSDSDSSVLLLPNGTPYENGTIGSSNYSFFGANDIAGVALDVDNGNMYLYKNGTIQNSGNPIFTSIGDFIMPLGTTYQNGCGGYFNFGGFTSYTPASPASDENGYGTFEYAPPSGYYALCTKNLAEYG